MIHIVIDGYPVPAARPRFARTARGVRTYNPAKVMQYRERLQAAASEQMQGKPLMEGPLSMTVFCVMPFTSGMSKKLRATAATVALPHTKKPDLDNLLKNFSDALNGIVFRDDAQIWHIEIQKTYGDKPRVEIWVE